MFGNSEELKVLRNVAARTVFEQMCVVSHCTEEPEFRGRRDAEEREMLSSAPESFWALFPRVLQSDLVRGLYESLIICL